MEEGQPNKQPASFQVPPNITVTLKQDKTVLLGPDWERAARILSLIAIPIVLAVIGAVIQTTLSRSSVNRDYVQLAVSVLTADKSKTPQELRDWAVDLLDENSPTKFSKEVAARLKGGEIEFPGAIAALLSGENSGGMAISADGSVLATVQNNQISIWNMNTGRESKRIRPETSAHLIAIALSRDAKILAAAGSDGTILIVDTGDGDQKVLDAHSASDIIGVAFAADGHLLTHSLDGDVSYFDVSNGQMIRRIHLSK